MKPVLYVIHDAKSAPNVVKNFSHPPKVDGKELKERHTLLLQGLPCTIYDLNRPAPWPESVVVDLPLCNEVLTYPVAFETPLETRAKLSKALTEFIISGPELEAESDDEEIVVAVTAVTTTVAEDRESIDISSSSEEDIEDDETDDE